MHVERHYGLDYVTFHMPSVWFHMTTVSPLLMCPCCHQTAVHVRSDFTCNGSRSWHASPWRPVIKRYRLAVPLFFYSMSTLSVSKCLEKLEMTRYKRRRSESFVAIPKIQKYWFCYKRNVATKSIFKHQWWFSISGLQDDIECSNISWSYLRFLFLTGLYWVTSKQSIEQSAFGAFPLSSIRIK